MQTTGPFPAAASPARRAAYACLALGLFLAFFWPLFDGSRTLFFRDHFNQFLAERKFLADSYGWWCPGNFLGVPAYADPQFGFWYPPSILFRLLPFPLSYNVHILLHFLLIGWFALLFARRHFTPAPALFFAVGATGCGLTLSISEFASYFGSYAWLYPLLYLLDTSRAPGQHARLLWLPLVLCCSLTAGGTLFSAANLALAIGALCWFTARGSLSRPRLLLLLGLTLIVCYLPAYYFMELYLRSSLRHGYEVQGNMEFLWSRLPDLFLAGRATWERYLAQPHTLYPVVYCGAFTGLLLFAGLRRAWPAALIAVAVIVLATGTGWTVLTAPVTWLRFRFPEKLLCYAAPALFYVAATGLQRLRLKVPLQYLLVILLAGELAWTQAGYFVRLPYAATLEAGRVYDLPAGSRVLTLVSESLLPDFSARDLAGHSREQLKYRYRFAATFYGLESYLGYSPAQLGAHAEINRVFSRGDIDARRKSLVLRNAGVRYVISKIRFSSAARMPRQPLWLPVLSVPHENLQVHEIDGALPRAALFTPAVAARMRTADDLTGDYPFLPVTGLVRTGDGLSCRVATDTPVVLVITSFAYPGMELEVDGRRRASGLAFGMFPALPLPPGQHRISFRYRPALLELNLVILFAGLAGCLWCARRWRDGSRDHAADC